MKCEHEGCHSSYARPVRITIGMGHDSTDRYSVLCDPCLVVSLRALADEVEGVKECDHCEGHGGFGENLSAPDPCDVCHGTGRVKA